MPDPKPERPTFREAPAFPTGAAPDAEAIALSRLFAKIAHAQATMPALDRGRTVTVTMQSGGSYTYDYVTEEQITKAMREHLSSLGVATFVSFPEAQEIGSGDGGMNVVRVKVRVTFGCAETGALFTVEGWGDGSDKGDKAIGKAETSGLRVLLGKNLLQAGGDDGESANHESSRQGSGAGGKVDARPATEGQVNRVFALASKVKWMQDDRGRASQAAVYDFCRWVTRGDEAPADGPNSLNRDQVQRVFNVIEAMQKDETRAGQVAAAIDEWLTSMGAGEEPQAPASTLSAHDEQIPFAEDTPVGAEDGGYGG